MYVPILEVNIKSKVLVFRIPLFFLKRKYKCECIEVTFIPVLLYSALV